MKRQHRIEELPKALYTSRLIKIRKKMRYKTLITRTGNSNNRKNMITTHKNKNQKYNHRINMKRMKAIRKARVETMSLV